MCRPAPKTKMDTNQIQPSFRLRQLEMALILAKKLIFVLTLIWLFVCIRGEGDWNFRIGNGLYFKWKQLQAFFIYVHYSNKYFKTESLCLLD